MPNHVQAASVGVSPQQLLTPIGPAVTPEISDTRRRLSEATEGAAPHRRDGELWALVRPHGLTWPGWEGGGAG
ncbi:unnamed protein product [Gadus morhua 'NCC']